MVAPVVPRPLAAAGALAAVAAVCFLPGSLSGGARLALLVLGTAMVAWTLTGLDETRVAVAAAAALVLGGVSRPGDAVAAALDPTVSLLVASFVVAAAVSASGLADRFTLAVARRAGSVAGLCWRLTMALSSTAFVIPATSGRAALALPVFLAVASAIGDRRVVRALALLFPTTILLSAIASLLGAGAHLVTAELVAGMTGQGISFGRWLVLGVPFAVASCGLSTWVILRLFLTAEERRRPVALSTAVPVPAGPLGRTALFVATVVASAVVLWATEPWPGLAPPVVAMAAAAALVGARAVPVHAAVAAVKVDLVVFLAATLVVGEALVRSGAARWLLDGSLGWLTASTSPWAVVTAVAAVSLVAHLVVSSRTARATVLLPLVVLVAQATALDATALAFVSTAGAGFCLTLPVSAKPVALFNRLDVETYDAADLRRLSRVLLPAHLVLLVVFAQFVWPALGLAAPTRAERQATDRPAAVSRPSPDADPAGPRRSPPAAGEAVEATPQPTPPTTEPPATPVSGPPASTVRDDGGDDSDASDDSDDDDAGDDDDG
jgi:sodium-dependent dicarboxylate transporter 2/3/5